MTEFKSHLDMYDNWEAIVREQSYFLNDMRTKISKLEKNLEILLSAIEFISERGSKNGHIYLSIVRRKRLLEIIKTAQSME